MSVTNDLNDLVKLLLIGVGLPIGMIIFFILAIIFCFGMIWFFIAVINHFAGYTMLTWG